MRVGGCGHRCLCRLRGQLNLVCLKYIILTDDPAVTVASVSPAAASPRVAGKQTPERPLALCLRLSRIRRSLRLEKDQGVLLSIQDKVLVGLRALSSSLTPDLHRHFQTALLALVAQSGFTKKVGSIARARCRTSAPSFPDRSASTSGAVRLHEGEINRMRALS